METMVVVLLVLRLFRILQTSCEDLVDLLDRGLLVRAMRCCDRLVGGLWALLGGRMLKGSSDVETEGSPWCWWALNAETDGFS